MAFKGKPENDQKLAELPIEVRSNSVDTESLREMSPLRMGRASLSLSSGRRNRISEVSVCSLSSLMKLDTVQYINLNTQRSLHCKNSHLDGEDSIYGCQQAHNEQGTSIICCINIAKIIITIKKYRYKHIIFFLSRFMGWLRSKHMS